MRITTIRHPEYAIDYADYLKWRLTYMGGRNFIDQYLLKYSKREDDVAFKDRRCLSYVPAYAKAAINKLKNTMYSRMVEISRIGGPESYISACLSKEGGVDRMGSSMNTFMGSMVLPELMTMKSVGIYVDRAPANGPLLSNNKGNKPYLYTYKAEDILTWDFMYCDGEYRYKNVLLRDTYLDYDTKTGMVKGTSERYRQVFMGDDGKVHVQFWLPAEDESAEEDIPMGPETVLDLDRIPFVRIGLKASLLADVADYQVALMNLASSDVNYVFRANFPTYIEQEDPFAVSIYNRGGALPPNLSRTTGKDPDEGTSGLAVASAPSREQRHGALEGRTYTKGMDPPSYIAPSPEPLLASIQKQTQMKNEIFELVDIAASQAQPQHASADSKAMDDRGLESGLSMIGLELEYGEREVAKIWALYENNAEPAFVNYPSKFTLKTDAQRVDECKALDEIKASAPSKSYGKEVAKVIATTMLGEKVHPDKLKKIHDEIDKAEYATSDRETLKVAVEAGLVDAVTASNAMGFDGEKVVPKAQEEHAERLKRINDAQAANNPAARGVPDASAGGQKDAKVEKVDGDS
jgi:hypothetical protein